MRDLLAWNHDLCRTVLGIHARALLAFQRRRGAERRFGSSTPVVSRYGEVMDATQVRRWIAGFEAVAEADRQAFRDRGIDRARSIGLSLSMIAAARRVLGQRVSLDPLRQAEDERVREVWHQLRTRLRR